MTTAGETHWDNLHAVPGFAPRYPVDAVVRWFFRSFPRISIHDYSILDVGCGAGRHAMFFAREGVDATACDPSKVGIDLLCRKADVEKLKIQTTIAAANNLPYRDASFDGVLSWGVLYYLSLDEIVSAVAEMRRVLKVGGHGLVMIKSNMDVRASGEEISRHRYRITNAPDGMPWRNEIGLELTLLDRNAVENIFAGFAQVSVENSRTTIANGRYVDDDWHIFFRR